MIGSACCRWAASNCGPRQSAQRKHQSQREEESKSLPAAAYHCSSTTTRLPSSHSIASVPRASATSLQPEVQPLPPAWSKLKPSGGKKHTHGSQPRSSAARGPTWRAVGAVAVAGTIVSRLLRLRVYVHAESSRENKQPEKKKQTNCQLSRKPQPARKTQSSDVGVG